jgi:CHAT domain/Ternary complex associated domain 7
MDLGRVASTDFVLLQADWLVGQARGLVEALSPERVIVQRRDGAEEYFYLETGDETLRRLRQSSDDETVRAAMDLHEWGAVPTLNTFSDAEHAPDQCVVLAADQVVGYFDVDDFVTSSRRRGDTTRGTTRDLGIPSYTPGETTRGTAAPTEDLAERSIEAEFPNTVQLNELASLTVSIVSDDESRSHTANRIPLALEVGTVIDILVQPKRGFVIEGSAERSLTISAATETLPVQFKLRAKELGVGQIRVLVFHSGVALGVLTLVPTVVEPSRETTPTERGTHTAALAPTSVRLPDLSLLIEETRVDGVRGFFMRISASDPNANLNLMKYGPIRFETDPGTYFEKLYADIEEYPLETPTDRAIAVEQLAAKGSNLFQTLVPKEARQKLWELRDKITTVFIQSEEPWIPWELCKLVGEEHGSIVEGPFLCEAFDLTRWIPGTGLKQTLTLNNIALVVPSDSGLAFAATEGDFIKSLAGGSHQVASISADFLNLNEALASGKYDAWHFTGHGAKRDPDPNRSIMYLEADQTFSPYNIAGRVQNLGKAQPLVFINACQIGQSGMSLTDIGGWARQFLSAGAGAFVGAYWSVYDEHAYNFARELYNRLLGGLSIGRAAREARLAIKNGDPTWLAYTIFADPLATVRA